MYDVPRPRRWRMSRHAIRAAFAGLLDAIKEG